MRAGRVGYNESMHGTHMGSHSGVVVGRSQQASALAGKYCAT